MIFPQLILIINFTILDKNYGRPIITYHVKLNFQMLVIVKVIPHMKMKKMKKKFQLNKFNMSWEMLLIHKEVKQKMRLLLIVSVRNGIVPNKEEFRPYIVRVCTVLIWPCMSYIRPIFFLVWYCLSYC